MQRVVSMGMAAMLCSVAPAIAQITDVTPLPETKQNIEDSLKQVIAVPEYMDEVYKRMSQLRDKQQTCFDNRGTAPDQQAQRDYLDCTTDTIKGAREVHATITQIWQDLAQNLSRVVESIEQGNADFRGHQKRFEKEVGRLNQEHERLKQRKAVIKRKLFNGQMPDDWASVELTPRQERELRQLINDFSFNQRKQQKVKRNADFVRSRIERMGQNIRLAKAFRVSALDEAKSSEQAIELLNDDLALIALRDTAMPLEASELSIGRSLSGLSNILEMKRSAMGLTIDFDIDGGSQSVPSLPSLDAAAIRAFFQDGDS